jgi:hypothetical protein
MITVEAIELFRVETENPHFLGVFLRVFAFFAPRQIVLWLGGILVSLLAKRLLAKTFVDDAALFCQVEWQGGALFSPKDYGF